MIYFNKYSKSTVIFVALLFISACGVVEQNVEKYTAITDISGLVSAKGATPSILYVRPRAPGLEQYNSFIIDPVVIDYRDPNVKKIDSADLERIQEYFRNSVFSQLTEAGYGITNQPGTNTMRITFIVSGIEATTAAANISTFVLPIAASVGEVTVEAAFRESVNSRIDAVAISRLSGSRSFNKNPWSTWGDVESAIDIWAAGIADAVKKAHEMKR